jgi:copper transport protein
MRRASVLLVSAGAFLSLSAPHGAAHALLRSSVPADGAQLGTTPKRVALTFTEQPEPSLSVIHVLDVNGTAHEKGKPSLASPRTLASSVRALSRGVYTVAWRVVSRVDGHVTAGAFTFGVGVSPAAAPGPPKSVLSRSPPPSKLEMGGRWGLFLGLVALLGGAWVGAVVFGGFPPAIATMVRSGWVVAVAGLVLLAIAQRRAAGVPFGDLLSVSLGRALLWRAIAIALAGAALLIAWFSSGGARRAALWCAGLGAAGAMMAHVAAGHAAAAGSFRWGVITAQWAHFCAIGVWIGGLVALLAGTRGAPSEEKAPAVRRFSTVALFALAVVAGTGILRAVEEVDGWGALISSGYGRVILIKSGLLAGLISLGAINRYRSVPAAMRTLRPLRRVSSIEIGIAVVALGAAAVLASLVPPSPASAGAVGRPGIVVRGADLGTSVRARLEVTPGFPGANRFVLVVTDFDTGTGVRADRVTLRFSYLDDPSVGESTRPLLREGAGRYVARGANLSLAGRWRVTALIERGVDSLEVPLQLGTRCRVSVLPGNPVIYTTALPQGSVQMYVDPGKPGMNEVHATYFDRKGDEMPVRDPRIRASSGELVSMALSPRQLSEGHFVADARLAAGRWRFDTSAVGLDKSKLGACFEETIGT